MILAAALMGQNLVPGTTQAATPSTSSSTIKFEAPVGFDVPSVPRWEIGGGWGRTGTALGYEVFTQLNFGRIGLYGMHAASTVGSYDAGGGITAHLEEQHSGGGLEIRMFRIGRMTVSAIGEGSSYRNVIAAGYFVPDVGKVHYSQIDYHPLFTAGGRMRIPLPGKVVSLGIEIGKNFGPTYPAQTGAGMKFGFGTAIDPVGFVQAYRRFFR